MTPSFLPFTDASCLPPWHVLYQSMAAKRIICHFPMHQIICASNFFFFFFWCTFLVVTSQISPPPPIHTKRQHWVDWACCQGKSKCWQKISKWALAEVTYQSEQERCSFLDTTSSPRVCCVQTRPLDIGKLMADEPHNLLVNFPDRIIFQWFLSPQLLSEKDTWKRSHQTIGINSHAEEPRNLGLRNPNRKLGILG